MDQAQGLPMPPAPPSLPPVPPSQPPLPPAEPAKLAIEQKKRKSTGLSRVVKELVTTNKAQMRVLKEIQAHMEGRVKDGHQRHDAKDDDDDDDDDDDEDE